MDYPSVFIKLTLDWRLQMDRHQGQSQAATRAGTEGECVMRAGVLENGLVGDGLHFPRPMQQVTPRAVAENRTNSFSLRSVVQKSDVGRTGLKSRHWQACGPSGNTRRAFTPPPVSASGGHLHPLARGGLEGVSGASP